MMRQKFDIIYILYGSKKKTDLSRNNDKWIKIWISYADSEGKWRSYKIVWCVSKSILFKYWNLLFSITKIQGSHYIHRLSWLE